MGARGKRIRNFGEKHTPKKFILSLASTILAIGLSIPSQAHASGDWRIVRAEPDGKKVFVDAGSIVRSKVAGHIASATLMTYLPSDLEDGTRMILIDINANCYNKSFQIKSYFQFNKEGDIIKSYDLNKYHGKPDEQSFAYAEIKLACGLISVVPADLNDWRLIGDNNGVAIYISSKDMSYSGGVASAWFKWKDENSKYNNIISKDEYDCLNWRRRSVYNFEFGHDGGLKVGGESYDTEFEKIDVGGMFEVTMSYACGFISLPAQ